MADGLPLNASPVDAGNGSESDDSSSSDAECEVVDTPQQQSPSKPHQLQKELSGSKPLNAKHKSAEKAAPMAIELSDIVSILRGYKFVSLDRNLDKRMRYSF